MQFISLSKLEADPRNANVCSPETLETIGRNIKRSGFCPALVVRPHPEKDGVYIIIDGHHRKKVLEQLGWEEAPCQIGNLEETDVELALATMNRLRGVDDPKKRAALLESLTETFSLEDLASLIPESTQEIEDLLALQKFDFAELETNLRKQTAREQATLPVPMTFMLRPEDVPAVEEALSQFQIKNLKKDKSAALVALCKHTIGGDVEKKST